jgi:hypothetical protein
MPCPANELGTILPFASVVASAWFMYRRPLAGVFEFAFDF